MMIIESVSSGMQLDNVVIGALSGVVISTNILNAHLSGDVDRNQC